MELHAFLLDSKGKHQTVQKIECHFYSSIEILDGVGKTSANTQEKNLLTLQLFLLASLDILYNNFLF